MGHTTATTIITVIFAACMTSYANVIRRLWDNNLADSLRNFWSRRPGGVTSTVFYGAIAMTWPLGLLTGFGALGMAASVTCVLAATGEILYRRKTAPELTLPKRQRM